MTSLKLADLKDLLCPALSHSELWPLLDEISNYKEVAAGCNLIQAGDHPQHTYIVASGLLRHFYHSPDGRERNKNFFREGQLAGSLSSQLTQQPCAYNLEAIEDSCLIQFPNHLFWALKEQHSSAQRMIDMTIQELFLRNEVREAVLLTQSGEERYHWLLENESWLAQRLPQYHLASYLGMDAVSLSRIKTRARAKAG